MLGEEEALALQDSVKQLMLRACRTVESVSADLAQVIEKLGSGMDVSELERLEDEVRLLEGQLEWVCSRSHELLYGRLAEFEELEEWELDRCSMNARLLDHLADTLHSIEQLPWRHMDLIRDTILPKIEGLLDEGYDQDTSPSP